MNKHKLPLVGLILGIFTVCVFAVSGADGVLVDRTHPFIIEADTAIYRDVAQSATFTGRVVLQQGTMRIQAQTVETIVDPEGYQYATAKGGKKGLVQFEQKREGTNEIMKAQAEQLIYDGKANVILLAKRARAQRVNAQGKIIDQIEADELTYNQLTEVFESNPKNIGRTHVFIAPRNPQGSK